MTIDLHRTFSAYKRLASDVGEQDWSLYLHSGGASLSWADLHDRALVVVLGEAGIGKTTEFRTEARRLRNGGAAAFFIALNQLSSSDSWDVVLIGHDTDFESWAASDKQGYFFLDADDEARLRSHADFDTALVVVQHALRPHLARVRIAISSRATDWSIPQVRTIVDVRLRLPLEQARATLATVEASLSSLDPSELAVTAVAPAPRSETFVVSLDPLSNVEARRCAVAFNLQDKDLYRSR